MNWKKFGYIVLLCFILLVINGATFAWLVMNFYGDLDTTIIIAGVKRHLNVAFWDTLDFKFKAITYALMFLGAFGSYGFIKLFYKNNRESKQIERERKEKKETNDSNMRIIEKIIEGKR